MRKFRIALAVMAIFSAQQVLADDMSSMTSKSCATVADACAKAGFERNGTTGKQFWKDCMKPLILAQTVQGVTVDPVVVKACRTDKVLELKKELIEFQNTTMKK
ncbi:MAG: hypothetical protein P4M12_10265 [Gammaproteobacteria bacterium]|nr:hypothetical protein [Gammaproteobacteria bacterium]